jgi:nucleotide-binding universal stress UspA family protein
MPLAYQRILCALDLTDPARLVLRRALALARTAGAELAAASVVDYQPGFEADAYPFLTPQEIRAQTVTQVQRKLHHLCLQEQAPQVEILVAAGAERATLIELAQRWQAQLVIIGSHAPFSLNVQANTLPFDCLTVTTRSAAMPWGKRWLQSLVPAF